MQMTLSQILNTLQISKATSIHWNKCNDSKRLNTDKCLIFSNRNNNSKWNNKRNSLAHVNEKSRGRLGFRGFDLGLLDVISNLTLFLPDVLHSVFHMCQLLFQVGFLHGSKLFAVVSGLTFPHFTPQTLIGQEVKIGFA